MLNTIEIDLNGSPSRTTLDELVYRSYFYQRERAPGVPWHEWQVLFRDAERFERRYQSEKSEA